jgi:hypothetical protein
VLGVDTGRVAVICSRGCSMLRPAPTTSSEFRPARCLVNRGGSTAPANQYSRRVGNRNHGRPTGIPMSTTVTCHRRKRRIGTRKDGARQDPRDAVWKRQVNSANSSAPLPHARRNHPSQLRRIAPESASAEISPTFGSSKKGSLDPCEARDGVGYACHRCAVANRLRPVDHGIANHRSNVRIYGNMIPSPYDEVIIGNGTEPRHR